MKRFSNILKKINTPPIYGALSILLGAAFIASGTVLDALLLTVGIIVLVIAAFRLSALFMKEDRSNPFFIFKLVGESLLLLTGIILVIMRSGVIGALSSIIGLYVTIHFLILLAMTLGRGERYPLKWVDVALSAAMVALGIFMMVNRSLLNVVIGILLITLGVYLIVKFFEGRIKKRKAADPNIYDAHYRDMSE